MSVTVVPYDKSWPAQFQQIKTSLEGHLRNCLHIRSIEHVGSTSVPGLAAKPIIDVDIVVDPDSDVSVQNTIDALVQNGGFAYLGDLGIPDRHVMRDPNQSPPRNIYITPDGTPQLRNHLGIRDTLRLDETLRDEYAAVKLALAAKGTNIVDYIVAKGAVIQKILRVSGKLTEEELAALEKANDPGERWSPVKSERLLLREFVTRDAERYFKLESNEINARYQDWEPRTMEQAKKMVLDNLKTSTDKPRRIWELVVEMDGDMIGRVGAKKTPGDGDKPNHFDLWFSVLAELQGKGYATEAMNAFIGELKRRHADRKIELEIECDPRNLGSWKLAEKLGFQRFSLTERAYESKGEWVDSLVYRKLV